MNYDNVAVMIHTFLRDDLMERCVKSVEKYLPGARIYLSDGGRLDERKEKYYDELEDRGHWVRHYEQFNYWWRKAFNEKVAIATEKYILKVDDDFVFDENSNLERLRYFLETDKSLGIIGGRVWHERHNDISHYVFDVTGTAEDGKYILDHSKHTPGGYIYCEFIPDFWLARREIFKDIQMENELQPAQGGHEVFFRKIYEKRQSGQIEWKVGYTNEATAVHEKSTQTEEYKEHRLKGFKSDEYFNNIKVVKPGRKPS